MIDSSQIFQSNDSGAEDNIQLLRSLFDLMPQLGWTALPDGFIDFYNKGWYDYTGTTYEDQQGWGWRSCHDPEMLPAVLAWYNSAVETKTTKTMSFPLRRHDGVYRWFLTRMCPIFDASGNLIRWVGINNDIQDERDVAANLERLVQERTNQLQQALEDSLKANKIKSQFVSTISHEVRTPMSGVIGLAEVLTFDEKLDSEQKIIAGEIFSSAQRLLRILNDILDFSKYESGQMGLEYRPLSVTKLVGSVIDTLQLEASKKSLKLMADIDKTIPDSLNGDELRLHQILNNLVGNAIKFTESGSVTISAAVEKAPLENQESAQEATQEDSVVVKFAVKDTGIGVSEEDKARLFQPFTQANESINRRFGGTGLGLAITKNYVELMNGKIDVDSESGQGSTFWFTVRFLTGKTA